MRVEIYSKADCPLCDEAKAVLREIQGRIDFELVETNIEADPNLFARFQYDIPVVLIDGQKAFKHHLDPTKTEARLRRALRCGRK